MITAIASFVAGLIIGWAAALPATARLIARVPVLARLMHKLPAPAASDLGLRLRAQRTIEELQLQVRNRVDVERNMTRIAQLRELIGDDA
jgi:hypothetical protein